MNTGRKKISVILPVKDGNVDMLRRAVASVLRQSEADFEILLADDGSRDAMHKALDEIAEIDSRIRVLHLEAGGVSAARNRALCEADGEIITYLDSDDALADGCFAEAVCILEDQTIDALWGGTCFVNEEEIESICGEKDGKEKAFESARGRTDQKPEMIALSPERLHRTRAECIGEPYRFSKTGYINRGIAARFIRKKALENHKLFFPEGIAMYEDAIWNLEMMTKLAICYVPRVWYYYLDNGVSASNRFHANGCERIEKPLMRIRTMLDLDDSEEYTAYTRFLMDSLRYVCKGMYAHPDWKPGPGEKRKLKKHLYADMPWAEIGSSRFSRHAEKRDRQKACLYRMRLLLAYWAFND